MRSVVTNYLPRRFAYRDFTLFELLPLDEPLDLAVRSATPPALLATTQPPLAAATPEPTAVAFGPGFAPAGAAISAPVCLPPRSLQLANGQRLVSLHMHPAGHPTSVIFQLVPNRRCRLIAGVRLVNRKMICAEWLDEQTDRWDEGGYERPGFTSRLAHAWRALGLRRPLRSRLAAPETGESETYHHHRPYEPLMEAGQPLFARLGGQYFLFGLHVRPPWPADQQLRSHRLALFFNVRRYRHSILDRLQRGRADQSS